MENEHNQNQGDYLETRVVRNAFAATSTEEDPSVFISYYRNDSQRIAESVQSWFGLRYGTGNVSTIAEIPPFVGSPEYYIREKLRGSDFLVVLIGPTWHHTLTDHLADNTRDDVMTAIRVALEEGKPIVPVCVDGAALPREIDLPRNLRPILNFPITHLTSEANFEDAIQWVFAYTDKPQERIDDVTRHPDFYNIYDRFITAFEAEDWDTARDIIQHIRSLGEVRRPFKLQLRQYERKVELEIRLRKARPVYAQVLEAAEQNAQRGWALLQAFLAEYPEHGDPAGLAEHIQPVNSQAAQLLLIASDPGVPANKRMRAAREMDEYGDPRPGTGIGADGLPEISWVRIPAGEFIYHYDKRMALPTYYIARYPITYAQFQAFIDAGGYEDNRWWIDLPYREGRPEEPEWRWGNHPRHRLSWTDAVAYCRWLSETLGYDIRLPTEPEWEKAARGPDGRVYPWGEKYRAGHANINETTSGVGHTNLRQPTPVGIYPQGASRYGVMDVIGNVWEWCINPEDDPASTDTGDEARRPLRGGSWLSEWMFAHTVRRRVQTPNSRFPDFGFRVMTYDIPLLLHM